MHVDPKNEIEQEMLEDIQREDCMLEIDLDDDIYSIGFNIFLRSDSPAKHERIIQKCIWAFLLQVVMLGLLAKNF
jgi:hypothetical protein